jgi:DNA-binding response OmpR family regulator
MKERILLVGEDPGLIATRALLLSDWETEKCNAFQAMDRIERKTFDLLIICQSVPDTNAKLLISAAKQQAIPAEILLIRMDRNGQDFGVDVRSHDLWESPAWLRKSVVELLGERVAA